MLHRIPNGAVWWAHVLWLDAENLVEGTLESAHLGADLLGSKVLLIGMGPAVRANLVACIVVGLQLRSPLVDASVQSPGDEKRSFGVILVENVEKLGAVLTRAVVVGKSNHARLRASLNNSTGCWCLALTTKKLGWDGGTGCEGAHKSKDCRDGEKHDGKAGAGLQTSGEASGFGDGIFQTRKAASYLYKNFSFTAFFDPESPPHGTSSSN